MAFIQVIQFKTSKIDKMREVGNEWEAAEPDGATQQDVVCKDRDNEGQYMNIAFFDSYEGAMEHSHLPTTQEFAQRMMSLADGPPTFYNLDVIDDRDMT